MFSTLFFLSHNYNFIEIRLLLARDIVLAAPGEQELYLLSGNKDYYRPYCCDKKFYEILERLDKVAISSFLSLVSAV